MLALIRLSIPVALTYLGIMAMGFVDLIVVGKISAAAVGAVGISNSLFSWFLVFGIGLLAGMDFPIAHSFGAGRPRECRVFLWQGLIISLAVSLPLSAVLYALSFQLDRFGFHPELLPLAGPFLRILALSLTPAYIFNACRNYLQSMGVVRPAFLVLLGANLLNAFLNYTLVFGELGFPEMGLNGSAWANFYSRLAMALGMLAFALVKAGTWDFRFQREPLHQVMRLGLPAAGQMVMEVGVFALTTALAGRFAPEAVAAHQIVLNLASLTFMVPLGIGAATAVRVGQAIGQHDLPLARRTGWQGLFLGASFMMFTAAAMLLWPNALLGIYSSAPGVLAVAGSILVLAALFQIFDGVQVVLTGALRGLGDTRTAMLSNLVGHWFLGLPVGVGLGFGLGYGIRGLWAGLALGLVAVALALLVAWRRKAAKDPVIA